MDASAYAFTHGVRRTRETLTLWQSRPLPVLGRWLLGSLATALAMLLAVLCVATLDRHVALGLTLEPPFVTGDGSDVLGLLEHNGLVLALHAMACVAGFIAGSSLPLQAGAHSGITRWVHERGGRIAIGFVVGATTFSLSAQTWVLGHELAGVSRLPADLAGDGPAGRPAACDPRAHGAVPAPGRLDHRQPPRRVGPAARRHAGHPGDRHPDAGGRRADRGVRLAAPVRRAHRDPPADHAAVVTRARASRTGPAEGSLHFV